MQPKQPDTPPRPSAGDRALEGRALANAKREQMRLRASRIRRTIATAAAGLFAAAFIGVYVQLASGHDPALVASAAKRSSTSALAATSAASTESETAAGQATQETESSASGANEEGTSSSAETEESSPSPVTTSQS
jgi:hypothetical protein